VEASRLLAHLLGYTGSTLLLLAAMAAGWSIFSGMSWLWAFERLGASLEFITGSFYGLIDSWRDRRIGPRSRPPARGRGRGREAPRRVARSDHHRDAAARRAGFPEGPRSASAARSRWICSPRRSSAGKLPPLHLLDPAPPATETVSPETVEYTSRLIERKLADFGVQVKVLAAMPGPVITRYEIEPAVGVKGVQIVNLARDLARALAMVSIRVVETVPGKSCMALELPNPRRQMVKLSEIISSSPYNDMASPLTVCLGKDIGGQPVVADLAKTPHLLVAGTTGSGKSVGVNAMILSMLYKAEPDLVRLIMVDPKMLELSIYEGIPHLLAPVVTDMKQAANALHWCVTEMEKRYKADVGDGRAQHCRPQPQDQGSGEARSAHSQPADADAGNPRAAEEPALHRRRHRRTRRPDDGRRQEGRGTDRPVLRRRPALPASTSCWRRSVRAWT
jgi:S-DNA-T family DNA segregation ATPase FtsK/SpoIIIE